MIVSICQKRGFWFFCTIDLYSWRFTSVNQTKLWSTPDRLSIHLNEKSTENTQPSSRDITHSSPTHSQSATGFWSARNPAHFDHNKNSRMYSDVPKSSF